RHAASVRPEPGSNSPLKTNRSWFIERAIRSFETDEIKYLFYTPISYNLAVCIEIFVVDFANKIIYSLVVQFSKIKFFSLSFSAAIRSYHVRFRNASFIFFFFYKVYCTQAFHF
ncbi:hypothetical protein, partial [Paenibacillus terrae]